MEFRTADSSSVSVSSMFTTSIVTMKMMNMQIISAAPRRRGASTSACVLMRMRCMASYQARSQAVQEIVSVDGPDGRVERVLDRASDGVNQVGLRRQRRAIGLQPDEASAR